jgi:P4 family phage/plasmid primase-like protien
VRRYFPYDRSQCVLFDAECYPNRWGVGFLGVGPEKKPFFVEDVDQLWKVFDQGARLGRIFCGFNSERYDLLLIQGILAGVADVHALSRKIIEAGNADDWPTLWAIRDSFPPLEVDHIDLCARVKKYGRFPSLKALAASLGAPSLRELPYDPDSPLDPDQWAEVIRYNANDLAVTRQLLQHYEGELEALDVLGAEYQLDLLSTHNAGVARRIVEKVYFEVEGSKPQRMATPAEVFYQPPSCVHRPEEPTAQAWYDQLTTTAFPLTSGTADEVKPTVPKAAGPIHLGRLTLQVGKGGIHSIHEDPELWMADAEYALQSLDAVSYYPGVMKEHGLFPDALGAVMPDHFGGILAERLAVKEALATTTDPQERHRLQVKAHGLKIILNSTAGLYNSPYSTLYDPERFLAITLTGQLQILELIRLLLAAGAEVFEVNTDGVKIKVRRDDSRWTEAVRAWEADTGMTLESEPLARVVILATNNLATLTPSGKVTRKGDTLGDGFDPDHVPSARVVGDAIAQALFFDQPVEDTIRACTDPLRFALITRRKSGTPGRLQDDQDGQAQPIPKVTRWYRALRSRQRIVLKYADPKHLGALKDQQAPRAVSIRLMQDLPETVPEDLDRGYYVCAANAAVLAVRGADPSDPVWFQGHALACEAQAHGLPPCPKKNGKQSLAGVRAAEPSYRFPWVEATNAATYTGPRVGILVLDLDELYALFRQVAGEELLKEFARCLTSVRGDVDPDDVRQGKARGKLIFRCTLPADHPIATMGVKRWEKKYGIEVFYGRGTPTILGPHPDGTVYRLDGELTDAPEGLIALLTPKPRRSVVRVPRRKKAATGVTPVVLDAAVEAIVSAPDGDQQVAVNREAYHLGLKLGPPGGEPSGNGTMAREEVAAALVAAVALAEVDDEPKAIATIHKALDDGQAKAATNGPHLGEPGDDQGDDDGEPPLNRTDLGNACRLVKRFGAILRYCPKWGTWLIWDESRWKEDDTGMIHRLAKKAIRAIGHEVAETDDDEEAKALLKWALTSEAKKYIDALIGLAWSEPGIPVVPADLNRDGWLLNVRNGTIDLRTGQLRKHQQADLITKLAPVRFDPDAQCPRWTDFLKRVLVDDELIGFLQRAAGYALTASVAEHVLFFLHGTGRNGKSTFLKVILTLLGDYCKTIDPNLLVAKCHPEHSTGLTDLDGRRFISTVEVEDGQRMAESLVKQLTGGENINARRMRQDNYEFEVTHKIFLAANHKPEIRGTDEGIWSRIKLIPFDVFIPPEERIKDLDKILIAEEGPGILNWLVQGCLEWQRTGLAEPQAVTDATAGYRTEMDALAGFLDDRCDRPKPGPDGKPTVKVTTDVLYQAYTGWCVANGQKPLPSRKFGAELTKRGFTLDKAGSKCWRWGLCLKTEVEDGSDGDDGEEYDL